MNVKGPLHLGHVQEILITEDHRFLDQALDAKVPKSRVDLWNYPGVKHRKAVGHILARWDPGRIDSLLGKITELAVQERHIEG
jgi:hypothetical protein